MYSDLCIWLLDKINPKQTFSLNKNPFGPSVKISFCSWANLLFTKEAVTVRYAGLLHKILLRKAVIFLGEKIRRNGERKIGLFFSKFVYHQTGTRLVYLLPRNSTNNPISRLTSIWRSILVPKAQLGCIVKLKLNFKLCCSTMEILENGRWALNKINIYRLYYNSYQPQNNTRTTRVS